MPSTPSYFESISILDRSRVSPAVLQKVRALFRSLKDQMASPGGQAAKMAATEIRLTASLRDVSKLVSAAGNPTKGAYALITAVMIQKATAAANIATESEVAACADAIASLGGDLTVAAVLAPETMGLGSIVFLVGAAMDSYDVGKTCFVVNGQPTHALKAK
jgi:hypothetical protein